MIWLIFTKIHWIAQCLKNFKTGVAQPSAGLKKWMKTLDIKLRVEDFRILPLYISI